MTDTRNLIRQHLLRFGEMPDNQKVVWLGHALFLLLQAELDRQERLAKTGGPWAKYRTLK